MKESEKNWEKFLNKVQVIFPMSSKLEIYGLERGKSPWDSLRTIQLYVSLRQVLGDDFEANEFLKISKFEDFKKLFN